MRTQQAAEIVNLLHRGRIVIIGGRPAWEPMGPTPPRRYTADDMPSVLRLALAFAAIYWMLLMLLLLFATRPCQAQVTIRNPQNLPVPETKVEVLLHVACRAVAEEFHVKDTKQLSFPLTLVLGGADERYSADEDKGEYTVYLQRWDEPKFTSSVLRLAIWRMLPRQRRDKLVGEILERAARTAPVEADTLHGERQR